MRNFLKTGNEVIHHPWRGVDPFIMNAVLARDVVDGIVDG